MRVSERQTGHKKEREDHERRRRNKGTKERHERKKARETRKTSKKIDSHDMKEMHVRVLQSTTDDTRSQHSLGLFEGQR